MDENDRDEAADYYSKLPIDAQIAFLNFLKHAQGDNDNLGAKLLGSISDTLLKSLQNQRDEDDMEEAREWAEIEAEEIEAEEKQEEMKTWAKIACTEKQQRDVNKAKEKGDMCKKPPPLSDLNAFPTLAQNAPCTSKKETKCTVPKRL